MSKKVIDKGLLDRDFRSLIENVLALKTEIDKNYSSDDNEICSSVERTFNNHGYECKIDKDQKEFTIEVPSSVCITGKIDESYVKLGMCIRFNGVEYSTANLQCGTVDIPADNLEIFFPVIEKMIREGLIIKTLSNLLWRKLTQQ